MCCFCTRGCIYCRQICSAIISIIRHQINDVRKLRIMWFCFCIHIYSLNTCRSQLFHVTSYASFIATTQKLIHMCVSAVCVLDFLAHLSSRLVGELIVYHGLASVRRRPSSTISNMNISATSRPIATKFYLKHHWVRGKAALGFGPDRIRTLVSTAKESSLRVIMEKILSPLFLGCFSSDSFHTCRQ